MQEIESAVKAVRRRLLVFRALDWAAWGLVGGGSAAAATLLVLKLFPNDVPAWPLVGALVGAGVAGGAIAALARGMAPFEAALRADSQLGLRERLSSAWLLATTGRSGEPAFAALHDDATRFARGIRASRDFRYKLPPHARHAAWPAIAIVVLAFLPQFDLLGSAVAKTPPPKPIPKITPEQVAATKESIREAAERIRKPEDGKAEADELQLANKLDRLAKEVEVGQKTPREAIADMSRLHDELRLREDEKARALQPFKEIKGLREAQKTQDMQQDLKSQDFDAAAKKLEALANAMKDPSKASAEDMEQLSKELETLANEVKENEQLSKALEQAAKAVQQVAEEKKEEQQSGGSQSSPSEGTKNSDPSPSQAGNSQSSNQQQQQANQSGESGQSPSAQGAQQASEGAAQSAAAAMQQAAAAAQSLSQSQQEAERLSELQAQLSQSMGECAGACSGNGDGEGKSGQGSGGKKPGEGGQSTSSSASSGQQGGTPGKPTNSQAPFAPGNSQQQGSGSGGPGIGRGGAPPQGGTLAQGFVDTFIPGEKNEGQIIAVFDIDAPAPKGDAKVTYSKAVQAYEQKAADTIQNPEIPAGYRNAVKDYFEAINSGKEKKK